MVVVKAKPVSEAKKGNETMRFLARLCFYYPQYTFAQARRLPSKRVNLLIKEAQRIEAERMLQLVNIATAPHTKKGQGVKKLVGHYKGIING